jgi:TonB-linked SusC/RagA family outer membrane protein
MTNLFLFSQNLFRLSGLKLKQSVLFFCLTAISFTGFSQQPVTLSGKITDETSNQTLIGVNIRIKGSLAGAITDADGQFTLTTKSELPVSLIVSYLGYKNQEIDVYENTPLEIVLVKDINKLDQVVVIGYGTRKREELTGSIVSIQPDIIQQSSGSSFDKALQGHATGVQVTQSSGSPGGAVSIRIRGGNSITGGNEPLYVIDGFPVYNNNSDANAGALNGPNVSALASINPNDIESIDILKDASATAIYGSRGANGVINLTTKRGKVGANTVTYSGSYGTQEITKTIDLLNAQDWAILKNDAVENTNIYTRIPAGLPALPLPFSSSALDSLGNVNNDWQSAAFRKAPVQDHQLSFTGGSENIKYSISLGYLNQQGILIGTDFERYSARVGLEGKISKKFNVGLNITGSQSNANVVSYGNALGGDIITSLLYMPPTVPIKDAKGNYTFKSPYESAVANPIATLNLSTNESKLNRVLGSVYGEYKFTEDLKAKILVGSDILNNKQNRYIPSTLFEGNSSGGIATIGSKANTSWLNENTITYSKSITSKSNFEALIGYTQQFSKTEGFIASSQGFANDLLEYNDLFSGSSVNKPSSSYVDWGLQSYLGRVSYNYSRKYFATASIRADGSSFAWQINKESFFSQFKGFISDLKLRLSAGTTGNQEISQYQSLSLLSAYPYPTGTGSTSQIGYAPTRIENPDLKWETTAQYDGGLDIGLYEERIKLVFDAYYKKTSDLLLNLPLPISSGFQYSLQNIGSVENKGIELGLNTENIQGKFTWSTDIAFSLNRNKVLSLGAGRDYFLVSSELQTASVIKVGEPLGSFWGYKANGIFKSTDDIANTPRLDQANTKPGDVRYIDVNKDGIITQAGDQTLIGNAQPKFIYGIGNNFSFYNFDLSIFFQGSYGNKIYSSVLQQLQLTTGYQNGIKGLTDHYTADNQDAQYPRANQNVPTTPISDLFVYDGSYLRLKTITLGYNLPKQLTEKIKISNLRVYATLQNWITWSKYEGYDPEVNYYDQNQSRLGVDASAYPNAKTALVGVSVTF